MNKKLIKQLKGIGAKYFETAKRGRVLANRKPVPLSDKGLYWGFYTEENVFQVWNGSSIKEGIKNPTFTLILKAIKKHTGQDLTQKPIKRQEIEALNVRMAKLEDALEAKNEAVDKNTARSVGNVGEIKRTSERVKVLYNKVKRNGGFAKDEAPKEEKKPFKVGDSVVIVCEAKEIYNDELISAIKNRETLIVAEPFCDPRNKIAVSLNAGQYFLSPSDLEHAPAAPKEKALVFGDMMECIGVYDCLSKGQEVVFLAHSKEEKGKFDVIDEYANHYCAPSSYFKPL